MPRAASCGPRRPVLDVVIPTVGVDVTGRPPPRPVLLVVGLVAAAVPHPRDRVVGAALAWLVVVIAGPAHRALVPAEALAGRDAGPARGLPLPRWPGPGPGLRRGCLVRAGAPAPRPVEIDDGLDDLGRVGRAGMP